MCLQASGIRPYQKWHWAGDAVFRSTAVPARRTIPRTRLSDYQIDIREFVSFEGNAVVRGLLDSFLERLPVAEQACFARHRPGDFDFRVQRICELFTRFSHLPDPRGYDTWYFPEETISRGGGDCEDLAFLLEALLEAAGISRACLRVALGTVIDHRSGSRHGHAWVAYQDERGVWRLLEPLTLVKRTADPPRQRDHRRRGTGLPDVEYIPDFVLNRHHLWIVRSSENPALSSLNDYVEARKSLLRLAPAFAVSAHEDILDVALAAMPANDLRRVKLISFWLDVDTLAYDPRDHFDFAYIAEGWNRVKENLTTGGLDAFARAVHSVADFYAHTYYGLLFAPRDGQPLPIYDPDAPPDLSEATYDFSPFSELRSDGDVQTLCGGDRATAAAFWKGKLISGQWWRWYSTYPPELRPDLASRFCLPDHDDVAVDRPKGSNRLLDSRAYARQFGLRRDAAIRHISALHQRWATGPKRKEGRG